MKYYVTTWVLSNIYEVESDECETFDGRIVSHPRLWGGCSARNWVKTKEEALKRFENQRHKKIASLKRQIAKLESLQPNFVSA